MRTNSDYNIDMIDKMMREQEGIEDDAGGVDGIASDADGADGLAGALGAEAPGRAPAAAAAADEVT